MQSVSPRLLRNEFYEHLQQCGDQERAEVLCRVGLQDDPLHTTSQELPLDDSYLASDIFLPRVGDGSDSSTPAGQSVLCPGVVFTEFWTSMDSSPEMTLPGYIPTTRLSY